MGSSPLTGLSGGVGSGRRLDSSRSTLARLHPGVREEVERLIAKLGGVVRVSRAWAWETACRCAPDWLHAVKHSGLVSKPMAWRPCLAEL